MRRVETTFTCDRCGVTETLRGDVGSPPLRWHASVLEFIDADKCPQRETALLCPMCRSSLGAWLEVER